MKKLSRYSNEEIEHLKVFMQTHSPNQGIDEIYRMKGKKIRRATFYELCKTHGIETPVREQRKSIYSPEVIEYLERVVPNSGLTIREIAQRVNMEFGTEYTPMQIKEIKVQKGIRSGWKSPKGVTNSGQFQKGMRPMNTRQVGELMCHSNDRVFFVKVSDFKVEQGKVYSKDNYKQLNHMFWNFWHPDDPIKKGEVIITLDGNLCNYAKENLKKISRKSLGSAVSYMNHNDLEHSDNPEMFACISAIKEIEQLSKEKEKKR